MQTPIKQYQIWFMWIFASGFFFAEYFARVAPSIMAPELMAAFHVKAFALGSLSAFFYYAYLFMQIPAGAMIDTLSTKKLLSTMALLCGLSCWCFSLSNSIMTADINRVVMGFSAAFAFIGALKIANQWFPSYRFGLLAGATQALGMLGAAMGEGPLAIVVQQKGWRTTMQWIAIVLMALAILMFITIRDKSSTTKNKAILPSIKQSFQGIGQVLTHRPTWINGLFAGCLYAPTAAFAELWGVSYLHTVNHISSERAAEAISMIFIGWAMGSPIAGWISDTLQRRKPIMWASSILSFIFISLVLYTHALPYWLLVTLLFLYGICNVAVATSYAVAAEINPKPLAGTAMGFTNLTSVIIGASFQPLIGMLLDKHWGGVMQHGAPLYSASNYQSAMILLPICTIFSIILCYFIKESFPRKP